jgi:hypothetical protein
MQAAPSDDSALPEYYDADWDRFVPGVKLANRILDLINKHYIKRERSEGHGDILMSGMCVELSCISLRFVFLYSIDFFLCAAIRSRFN